MAELAKAGSTTELVATVEKNVKPLLEKLARWVPAAKHNATKVCNQPWQRMALCGRLAGGALTSRVAPCAQVMILATQGLRRLSEEHQCPIWTAMRESLASTTFTEVPTLVSLTHTAPHRLRQCEGLNLPEKAPG